MTKNSKNAKTSKVTLSFKKPHIKIFFIITPIILTVAAIIVAMTAMSANDTEEKEISKKIDDCVKETKKNMLGFITYCYEENGKEAPEDVLKKDKERADRILAQSAYDLCLANAQFYYQKLWDLNDTDRQNGKMDDTYNADFVDTEYNQQIELCKTSTTLIGSYEDGFMTKYKKVLTGWKKPKSDKIAILDRYNEFGKITEGSNLSEDQAVPDTVGSVGEKVAGAFKEKHQDLWY